MALLMDVRFNFGRKALSHGYAAVFESFLLLATRADWEFGVGQIGYRILVQINPRNIWETNNQATQVIDL